MPNEQEQQQHVVDPQLIIDALERKLTQANHEIVCLEAVANQQQQHLIALSEALEGATAKVQEYENAEKANAEKAKAEAQKMVEHADAVAAANGNAADALAH